MFRAVRFLCTVTRFNDMRELPIFASMFNWVP
jgi:hypothetical protein